MNRPRPPLDLLGDLAAAAFVPAPELLQWLTATFLEEGGALFNQDHQHLLAARMGVLWTNVANARAGRRVLGQCEFRPPMAMGTWQRARAKQQLLEWFGEELQFLLTFDAGYAAECTDAEFCALVEHELYHCGQARDDFGAPRFDRSGFPVFQLRGHDVEEFVGVVKRYGAEASHVEAFVAAAGLEPIDMTRIRAACGTCG